MSFTRPSANLTPIVDNVFSVVALAKEDILNNGAENVINATIGSLYNEMGELVAFESVFNHFDEISHQQKAAYSSSFTGNPSYRTQIKNWLFQERDIECHCSVIATPGGSGAISTAFNTILEQGQTVIIPDIAWGSYKLMAEQQNFKHTTYSMFDEDSFNINSLKETCLNIMKTQEKLLVVINDPCHNPTGYSMSMDEWKEVIEFLNECSKQVPVVLLNDVAYIDYGYDTNKTRDYLTLFNLISENVLVLVAFSCSKSLTSYGLRCGAAILIGKNENKVRETEIVFEKSARAIWSNITNSAMENFTWVTTENYDNYMNEKQNYIQLLKQRSEIFINEAKKCNLPIYPYQEGFFITVKVINENSLNQFHQKLIDNHIYTVKVNKGIRVGVCSCSINKITGLAMKMNEILKSCEN